MIPYDFAHLALLAVGGEVSGKTKLQKTVYFLGLLTGQLDDLGYHAHYFGPYSEEVADAVAVLENLAFVSANVTSGGRFDPQGFELRRTDYRLTDDGHEMAQVKARKHPELFAKLTEAAAAMRRAGDLDYVRLSIAAKADFMLRQNGAPATEDELERLAPRFGWKVTADQFRQAAAYLRQLLGPAPGAA